MNISIPTPTLLRGLKLAASVADRKATMPLLGCVLLRASGKTLTLSATDLALSLTAELPCTVTKPGAIALPAADLQKFIASVSANTIAITADGTWATVSANKSRYKIAGHSDHDFPKIPEAPAGQPIDAVALYELLARTSYAACRDETRMQMCGVVLKVDGGTVTAGATDGHRAVMVVRDTPMPRPARGQITVTARGAVAISSLLDGAERCAVSYDDRRIYVSHGDTTIAAALIDQEFPPLKQVFPQHEELKSSATLPRERLLEAIQRVAPLSTETRGIRIESTETGLRLLAADANGQELVDEIEGEIEGEIRFGVRAKYATECLQRMAGETITVRMMDPLYPIVFNDHDDPGLTAIIMPMRMD